MQIKKKFFRTSFNVFSKKRFFFKYHITCLYVDKINIFIQES